VVSGGKNNRAARTDRTARQSLRLAEHLEEDLITNAWEADVNYVFQPACATLSQRPRPTMQANQMTPTSTV
jgi:hypothetical protein